MQQLHTPAIQSFLHLLPATILVWSLADVEPLSLQGLQASLVPCVLTSLQVSPHAVLLFLQHWCSSQLSVSPLQVLCPALQPPAAACTSSWQSVPMSPSWQPLSAAFFSIVSRCQCCAPWPWQWGAAGAAPCLVVRQLPSLVATGALTVCTLAMAGQQVWAHLLPAPWSSAGLARCTHIHPAVNSRPCKPSAAVS